MCPERQLATTRPLWVGCIHSRVNAEQQLEPVGGDQARYAVSRAGLLLKQLLSSRAALRRLATDAAPSSSGWQLQQLLLIALLVVVCHLHVCMHACVAQLNMMTQKLQISENIGKCE